MITVMTRRLDRVTLVRASNSQVVEQAAIASFGIANDYAKNGDLKKQPKSTGLFLLSPTQEPMRALGFHLISSPSMAS